MKKFLEKTIDFMIAMSIVVGALVLLYLGGVI